MSARARAKRTQLPNAIIFPFPFLSIPRQQHAEAAQKPTAAASLTSQVFFFIYAQQTPQRRDFTRSSRWNIRKLFSRKNNNRNRKKS